MWLDIGSGGGGSATPCCPKAVNQAVETLNNHPYNIVAVSILRYMVRNIVTFDFVHIIQP